MLVCLFVACFYGVQNEFLLNNQNNSFKVKENISVLICLLGTKYVQSIFTVIPLMYMPFNDILKCSELISKSVEDWLIDLLISNFTDGVH